MTMQTNPLPFQVSGASALAQPQRNAAAGVQAQADGGQFGATLSREIAQRQATAPSSAQGAAPASASANKPATTAKPADKPATQGPKAAAREPARQNEPASDAPATAQAGAQAEAADSAQDAAAAADSASAAAEAAAAPVTDMLAFMASLAQPAPAAAVPVTAEAPLPAAGADQQLAALQSAFAKLDTADGATAAPALGVATEGDAADGGFALAPGVQPAPDEAADLRGVQQAAQAAVQGNAQDNQGKLQVQARQVAVDAAAIEAPAPAVTQLQAQAAKLDALNPAAVPADRIPARVGTQAWDNQVSQRIVYMVGKEQAATLTLNPPDLGPVQVVLNVGNDGASVAFSSSQPEVRQALENALPRLREMMSESGIALGNATVDAGTQQQRQAQDGERRGNGGAGGPRFADSTEGAGAGDAGARPATRTVALGERGMVDTFA
ncbi:flagellar hook-length control protein FliK [Massilia yuzhufengensis]|uniref:Flagellar hook-length control protein FliK n=1 Tax=Massilia yuzhufengensis TaxID=1164594 RepID=A0A1I1MLI0_9BURK|nr:flagellar hook-length control protein FliK [Massilia yuzhufengensis]SFC85946.1 flagellar hook-length control protein FliK [Massilia yuzhufengensis]